MKSIRKVMLKLRPKLRKVSMRKIIRRDTAKAENSGRNEIAVTNYEAKIGPTFDLAFPKTEGSQIFVQEGHPNTIRDSPTPTSPFPATQLTNTVTKSTPLVCSHGSHNDGIFCDDCQHCLWCCGEIKCECDCCAPKPQVVMAVA